MKEILINIKNTLIAIYKRILNLLFVAALIAIPIGSGMAYLEYQEDLVQYNKNIDKAREQVTQSQAEYDKNNQRSSLSRAQVARIKLSILEESRYEDAKEIMIEVVGSAFAIILALIIHSYIFFSRLVLWHRTPKPSKYVEAELVDPEVVIVSRSNHY